MFVPSAGASFRFSVVSLFAGCGGSSLGYKMAGGEVSLAVERDDNAVVTYHLNFPETPVYHGDIAQLSVRECLDRAGLEPGTLDILDGSPPCQGFSTAGRRRVQDPRNQLFREYVRLLRGLRPKAFVMENVSGLVKGKMRWVFVQILRELRASGYRVRARLMNAMYYGVPQNRQRVIFIGVRDDLGVEPSHPRPQAKPVTVREALRGCPVGPVPRFDDKYARLWPRVPVGGNASDVIGKGFNSCVKIDPDKPAPTLPKTQTGRGFATVCHWAEPRALSIPEAKRLASFPDEFRFLGTYSQQWARIGNAVPPLFMKAIAEHIRDTVLVSCGTCPADVRVPSDFSGHAAGGLAGGVCEQVDQTYSRAG